MRPPEDFWRFGWNKEEERLAVEASRPSAPGEIEWRPVKRTER